MTNIRSACPVVALIGCGAIAEQLYLPALSRWKHISEKLILVDTNEGRIRELSALSGSQHHTLDYREIIDKVDGAIVAVPHHLHYPVTMDFLRAGVHVLCEKPLAESTREACNMVRMAEERGVTLSVNNTRRLFPAYAKVKVLLDNETIGRPLSIEYLEGSEFKWPTASGFYFDSSQSAKGVLLDRGAHVLDLMCWWLDGRPDVLSSESDSFGGCETVSHVRLKHSDCICDVRLSWLYKLPNTFKVMGESGTIHGSIYDWDRLSITRNDGTHEKPRLRSKHRYFSDFGKDVVGNFLDVIRGNAQPLVAGRDVLNSIALLEECYAKVSRFDMPWNHGWVS